MLNHASALRQTHKHMHTKTERQTHTQTHTVFSNKGYETMISSSESEESECLLDGEDMVRCEHSDFGEGYECVVCTLLTPSSSSSSSGCNGVSRTSLRSGWGLVRVGSVCSLQPPDDSSSRSLEFLHFILRFWNQIFTCTQKTKGGTVNKLCFAGHYIHSVTT